MSRKYLVLKGCAGLGNRLLTLSEAVGYAAATGRCLHVDWSDGMFGPRGDNVFPRYFEVHGVPLEPSLEPVAAALAAGASTYPVGLSPDELRGNIYDWFNTCGARFARLPIYRRNISRVAKGVAAAAAGLQIWHRGPESTPGYFERISGVRDALMFPVGESMSADLTQDIVLYADLQPAADRRALLGRLSLRPDVEAPLDTFARDNALGLHGIGVHIRATDRRPPHGYDRLMRTLERLLDADPADRVFLSTDNPAVQADIIGRLGEERIVTWPKTGLPPESSSVGLHQWALWHGADDIKEQVLRDSIADMWLLSKCRTLYWQGNSSFSLLSAMIHRAPAAVRDWLV